MACKTALISLALPALASAHAFITQPAMRGGASGNSANAFCPQCLGTTALPMPTCGTDTFLNWDTDWAEVPTLVAGGMTEFKIKVTAHHMGHFVFRICDRPIDGSLGGLDAEERCLSEHVLERVRPDHPDLRLDCRPNDDRGDCQPMDDNHPGYWYLPPVAEDTGRGAGTYSFHYWVPANLTCERCTLQWWWMSANSCTPHPDAYEQYFQKIEELGWNASSWCSGGNGACCYKESDNCWSGGRQDCGEQFKNCADVRVVSGDGGPPPSPTTAAPPTSASVTTPAPTETQAPTSTEPSASPTQAPVGGVCQMNKNCSESDWCTQADIYEDWCPDHSATNCPSPQCKVVGGSETASLSSTTTITTSTTTTTTARSTISSNSSSSSSSSTSSSSSSGISSTSTTSTASVATTSNPFTGGLKCVASPGLNRGVSDSDCKQCETGYEFWPCNEDTLCQCSESVAELSVSRRLTKRSGHGFLSPDHAMLQVAVGTRTEL